MALPDYTVSRPGQANASGDALALFLKVFAGEVLTTFTETNVMKKHHMLRSITSGKTASFPVIGITSASRHVPGDMIDGSAIKHNERLIHIDDQLISPVFIANIDEAMNHYDYRAPYSDAVGRALALTYDQEVLQVGCQAARAAATITGGSGGSQITNAAFETDGDAIAEGLFDAAQALDEKNVPKEGRTCFLRPAQFYALARSTKVLNKDWGGSGAYAQGTVGPVAGIMIVETNNLPSADITSDTGTNNDYSANFTNTVGLILHPSAIGTVSLRDVSLESAYLVQNQGTLMVGKLLDGHGILRPECAIELLKA